MLKFGNFNFFGASWAFMKHYDPRIDNLGFLKSKINSISIKKLKKLAFNPPQDKKKSPAAPKSITKPSFSSFQCTKTLGKF